MKIRYKIGIWLGKKFDVPKYRIGEQVVVLPERVLGEVIGIGRDGGAWSYLVKFSRPISIGGFMRNEWFELGQSLALPYVEDILQYYKNRNKFPRK